MGQKIKLGTFDTAEEAFNRYKVYKEDLIRDVAEQYRDMIPDKVYRAMMNWTVEIEDWCFAEGGKYKLGVANEPRPIYNR